MNSEIEKVRFLSVYSQYMCCVFWGFSIVFGGCHLTKAICHLLKGVSRKSTKHLSGTVNVH